MTPRVQPIDIDELRRIVAIKHGLVLGKDDPILVTLTLNEAYLQHFIDLVHFEASKNHLEFAAVLEAHTKTATKISEQIINQATKHLIETSVERLQATLASHEKRIIKTAGDIERARAQTSDDLSELKKLRTATITAALFALSASALAVVVVMLVIFFA